MKNIKLILGVSLLAVAMVCVAFAQLDPGTRIYLYENGERVGEVYVPERDAGQATYVEHWVLYPNYRYPGPLFISALQIVPSPTENPHDTQPIFFRNVPFAKDSKYIRVTAEESKSLPVVR